MSLSEMHRPRSRSARRSSSPFTLRDRPGGTFPCRLGERLVGLLWLVSIAFREADPASVLDATPMILFSLRWIHPHAPAASLGKRCNVFANGTQ